MMNYAGSSEGNHIPSQEQSIILIVLQSVTKYSTGECLIMFDISVLAYTHRRIKTTMVLLESLKCNTVANVQLVIIGDRSNVESVDVPTMSVNEFFGSREDITVAKTPDESIGKKYVFVECQCTKQYTIMRDEKRWDWPNPYVPLHVASEAVPFCDSRLVFGPTEDDMYFLRHWDEELLSASREYGTGKYVFVHTQADANHLPNELRPHIKDPIDVSHATSDMMNTPELDAGTIDVHCQRFYESVKNRRFILPVEAQITELAPLLIEKDIITKIGGFHERPDYEYDDIFLKLKKYGIQQKIQTGALLFHNYYKQRIKFT